MSEIMNNLDTTRARVARELQQLADDIFDAHTKYAGTTTIYRSDMDIVGAQVASFRSRLQAVMNLTMLSGFFRDNTQQKVFYEDVANIANTINDYMNSVRNTFKNQKPDDFCEGYRSRSTYPATSGLVVHRDRLNPQKVIYGIPGLALAVPYTVRKK